MSRIIQAKVGPLATASATNIVNTTSGPTTAGTAFTLTSNPFVMDTPRRVLITSAGTDTSVVFVIVGTDWSGLPITENLAGGSNGNPVTSVCDYATVISVTPTVSNTAGTNSVGTTTVASCRPIFLDPYGYAPTSLQVDVTGTVNFTVSQTLDNWTDPNWLQAAGALSSSFANAVWINHPDSNLVANTVSVQGNYAYVPAFTRITLNSGSGSAILSVIQAASPS